MQRIENLLNDYEFMKDLNIDAITLATELQPTSSSVSETLMLQRMISDLRRQLQQLELAFRNEMDMEIRRLAH